MTDADYFEARRYSAVIMQDPRLNSLAPLLRAWQVSDSATVASAVGPWRVTRLTFESRRNYYPPAISLSSSGEGHPHEVYVAQISDSVPVRRQIIAAPYVRLLAEAMRRLDSGLKGDAALAFARPNMAQLFDHFERSFHQSLTASRIEVKMRQSGLDRVALSGRNPLRSDLRQALDKVSVPYSIRVRSSATPGIRPTNINLDLHGNVWWHLSNETAWGNVVPLLDLVFASIDLEQTGDLPLLRLGQTSETDSEETPA